MELVSFYGGWREYIEVVDLDFIEVILVVEDVDPIAELQILPIKSIHCFFLLHFHRFYVINKLIRNSICNIKIQNKDSINWSDRLNCLIDTTNALNRDDDKSNLPYTQDYLED